MVAMTGILFVYQSKQASSNVSKPMLTSKPLIPNYRMASGNTKKVAAVPQVMPLKKDGIPARARRDFMAVKNRYNLSLIPTYDGSNQSTHPKLLYFPNGWNGYRYWMSITPYPGTDDDFENPCMVTSNDLKTWVVPKGLKNPVTGVPDDVKYGGHYSDSQLVMHDNIMELWYRSDRGNRKTRNTDYRADYYYRTTSTDGIRWSKAQMMHSSPQSILSLAAVYRNGQYDFWYTDRSSRLMHAVSKNGTAWTNPQACRIPLPKGYSPWHQDVVFYNNKYYLLQTGIYHPNYSFDLFLSESTDGIHFTKGTGFYPSDNDTILRRTWLYRSTFVPTGGGMFQMVISYRLPGNKWFMTQCALPVADWDRACQTNRKVILKAPRTALETNLGIAPKAISEPVPRAKPKSSQKAVPKTRPGSQSAKPDSSPSKKVKTKTLSPSSQVKTKKPSHLQSA